MEGIIKKPIVLVVDDEENILEMIRLALETDHYEIRTTTDPQKAIADLKSFRPDVVITDIKMSGMDGLEVLANVKKIDPSINIILITAHASVDTAVNAIRGGAFDYLIKPFKINDLRTTVKRALSAKKIDEITQKEVESNYKMIIGKSEKMQSILSAVDRVAREESTVLITGESGTGKELVAQRIHYKSKRNKRPFVSINCAALPENLLESELFGYEKGAFTGANTKKIGLFEYAHKGTIFLDEVGDMAMNLQVRILRVLQERELKRVGGVEEIRVDVRVVAATNQNLERAVSGGQFREDLFFRLNVIPIHLPPLRERREDIPELICFFLEEKQRGRSKKRKIVLSRDAEKILNQYSWPGNVRELDHIIERILIMTEAEEITGQILRDIFGDKILRSNAVESSVDFSQDISLEDEKAAFEKKLISDTLSATDGNKMRAAKKLGLTRQNLQYKLKKHGIG